MSMTTETPEAGRLNNRIRLMYCLFLSRFALLSALFLAAAFPLSSAEAQSVIRDNLRLSLSAPELVLSSGAGQTRLTASFDAAALESAADTVTVTFMEESFAGGGRILFNPSQLAFTPGGASSRSVEVRAEGFAGVAEIVNLTATVTYADQSWTEKFALALAPLVPTLHLEWCENRSGEVQLAEGEEACLVVRATDLQSEQTLEISIASDHPDDLSLSLSTVTLTAAAPSVGITAEILADLRPEPAERVRLTATAAGLEPAAVEFEIAGTIWTASVNKPAVREGGTVFVRLEAENLQAGENLTMHIAVDEEHEADVHLATTAVTVAENGRGKRAAISVLRDGEAEGRETVTLTVSVEGFTPRTLTFSITGVRLSASAATRFEGDETFLEIQSDDLRQGESLAVRITVDPDYDADVRLSTDMVTLVGNRYQAVQIFILEDDVLELSELVTFTVSAADAVPGIEDIHVELLVRGLEFRMEFAPTEVREINRTDLELIAEGLAEGEELEVELAVDPLHTDDVSLSSTLVKFTFPQGDIKYVEALALLDGRPEPREEVLITATVVNPPHIEMTTTASFFIARNGYAIRHASEPEPRFHADSSTAAAAASNTTAEIFISYGTGRTSLTVFVDMTVPGGMTDAVIFTFKERDFKDGGEILFDPLQLVFMPGEASSRSVGVRAEGFAGVAETVNLTATVTYAGQSWTENFALALAPLPPTLHLEWCESGSGAAQLAEGEEACLTAQALNLPENGSMDVRLSVDAEHAGDILLSASTGTLTAGASTMQVRVTATDDGQAEPRETVRVTVSDAAALTAATARLTIPRNSYEMTQLSVAPRRMLIGEEARARAELNAPAPTTFALTVWVSEILSESDGGFHAVPGVEPLVARIEIPRGGTTASVGLRPQTPGRHVVYPVGLQFSSSAPGDQRSPLFSAEQLVLRVDARQLTLQASLERTALRERERTTLTVGVAGLPFGESVDIYVVNAHPEDILLPAPITWTLLHSDEETAQISIRALGDGVPEEREEFWLEVNSPDAPARMEIVSARVELTVGRNDYRVRELRAPSRIPEGEEALVEAELNAPAPSTATLIVEAVQAEVVSTTGRDDIRRLPGGGSLTARMEIPRGASSGSVALRPEAAGIWAFSVLEARFSSFEPGDQEHLPVDASVSAALTDVQPQTATLQVKLERRILREGETAMLRLSAAGLSAGGLLTVHIQSDPAGDVLLSPATVTLSGSTPTAETQALALADGLAESREKIRLEARAAGSSVALETSAARTSLTIPRNGYAVTDLQIAPTVVRSGEALTAEFRLNAPAPAAADILLQLTLPDGRRTTETVRVAAGRSAAQAEITPENPGVHEAQAVRAMFLEGREGDQRLLELSALSTSFELALPTLQLSVNRKSFHEGEGGHFTLRALHLRPGESLEVKMTVDAQHERDIDIYPGLLILTASQPVLYALGFWALEDEAEPRETVTVTASAAGAVTATVSFDIEGEILALDVLERWAREGDNVRVRLRAFDLNQGDRLEVLLTADAAHAADVRLTSDPVILTASAPERVITAELAEDGLAEPQETVTVNAWLREGGRWQKTASDSFIILLNGYELTELRIEPPEPRAGETFTAEFEMNAPAPKRAWVEMRFSLVNGDFPLSLRAELWIARGDVRGSTDLNLPVTGEWEVETLHATFLNPAGVSGPGESAGELHALDDAAREAGQ